MPFQHLVGNAHIKDYLTQIVQTGRVGQSFLFSGPPGVGKRPFAYAFAKLLVCGGDLSLPAASKAERLQHPDVHIYRPAGKVSMHSIEALRQLGHEVALPANEAPKKVFIIEDAERMLPTSSNALLKTFEEPSQDTVIILVTDFPSQILPTIHSRCRQLHFHAIAEETIRQHLEHLGINEKSANFAAMLAHGSLGKAIELTREGDDPNRVALLEALSVGGFRRYGDLRELAQTIGQAIDAKKAQVQAEAEEKHQALIHEKMSAVQRDEMRKEIDGAVSGYQYREVSRLLEVVQGWYRDMLLIRLGGDPSLLLHRDYQSQLTAAVEKKRPIPPLEFLEKSIGEALTSLKRSTSPASCFETLFLKLNL